METIFDLSNTKIYSVEELNQIGRDRIKSILEECQKIWETTLQKHEYTVFIDGKEITRGWHEAKEAFRSAVLKYEYDNTEQLPDYSPFKILMKEIDNFQFIFEKMSMVIEDHKGLWKTVLYSNDPLLINEAFNTEWLEPFKMREILEALLEFIDVRDVVADGIIEEIDNIADENYETEKEAADRIKFLFGSLASDKQN